MPHSICFAAFANLVLLLSSLTPVWVSAPDFCLETPRCTEPAIRHPESFPCTSCLSRLRAQAHLRASNRLFHSPDPPPPCLRRASFRYPVPCPKVLLACISATAAVKKQKIGIRASWKLGVLSPETTNLQGEEMCREAAAVSNKTLKLLDTEVWGVDLGLGSLVARFG